MSSRSLLILGFCLITLICSVPLIAQLTDQDRRYCAQQKTSADRQRCEQQIMQQRVAEQQRQQQLQQQLAAQKAAAAQKATADKAAAEKAAELQRQQQLQQYQAAQKAATTPKLPPGKATTETSAEQQRRQQMLQQNEKQIAAQKAVLRPYTKDDALGNLKLWLELDFCHSNQAFSLRELQNADAGGSLSAGVLQTAIEAAAPWSVLNQINQQVKQYQNKSITDIEARTTSIEQRLRTNDPIAAYRNSYCAN